VLGVLLLHLLRLPLGLGSPLVRGRLALVYPPGLRRRSLPRLGARLRGTIGGRGRPVARQIGPLVRGPFQVDEVLCRLRHRNRPVFW
jgi:hypothetical protein